MSERRLEQLRDKYQGRVTDPECFICVKEGWWSLLDALIADLLALGWDGQIDQVKEKFGGLRFYVGDLPEGGDDRIIEAEKESFRTCEVCGAGGERRGGSWILTLCDKHHRDRRWRL